VSSAPISERSTQLIARSRVSRCRFTRVQPTLDFGDTIGRVGARGFFDNPRAFMLDRKKISPIIYIWYEGGWLSPPVVTAKRLVGGWVTATWGENNGEEGCQGREEKGREEAV